VPQGTENNAIHKRTVSSYFENVTSYFLIFIFIIIIIINPQGLGLLGHVPPNPEDVLEQSIFVLVSPGHVFHSDGTGEAVVGDDLLIFLPHVSCISIGNG
jgi:hypothetical protein